MKKPINLKINYLAEKYFSGNSSKFAKEMSTSEANIRNYRGEVMPKIDFIVKLHRKLEISYEWLLDDKVSLEQEEKKRKEKEEPRPDPKDAYIIELQQDKIKALEGNNEDLKNTIRELKKELKKAYDSMATDVERKLKEKG